MKKEKKMKLMMQLMGLTRPLAGYILLAVFMGTVGHLCAAGITVSGAYAILEILHFETPFGLRLLFIGLGVFALMRGLLRYGEQLCNHFIAFKLLALIRDRIFQALRRLSPAKLEGRDKGNLISVITSDIELLEVFYAHTISPVAIAVLFSLVLCLWIGSYHWLLGFLALTAYLVVGTIIPVIISRLSRDDGRKFRAESGDLSSFVLDSLRGLPEILQYGMGKKRLEDMRFRTDKLIALEEGMKRKAGRNMAVTNTVILVFDLVMLFIAAGLYQEGAVGFDGVLVPTITLMSSFGPVIALANLGNTLQNTFAAGERVLDILNEPPAVTEIHGQPEIVFSGASAQDVTFSYEKEPILQDISLNIPKNSIVGIAGKSGSGKSTLLKLFMRFWEVQQGKILISDTPIGQINTQDVRDMEGYVTQETHLFHDSIASNLRIAKLDATQSEMENACKKASVHEFIMSLPHGYDTQVGELGESLSGGERQRLGLARAFLHNSPFLLLDEPTSNLDSLNESIILKALDEERDGKTVVIVSHRQSTMRIADMVYSVEQGRMCR